MWIPETGSESARVLLHGNHWTWKIRKHWHCHQLSIKRWTSIVSVTLCRALQKHLKRPHHHQSTVIKVDEKIEREGTHPEIILIQCGTIINCPWCDYKIYLSYANNNNLWQLRCSRRICNEWLWLHQRNTENVSLSDYHCSCAVSLLLFVSCGFV